MKEKRVRQVTEVAAPFLAPGEHVLIATIADVGTVSVARRAAVATVGAIVSLGTMIATVKPRRLYIAVTERSLLFFEGNTPSGRPGRDLVMRLDKRQLTASDPKEGLMMLSAFLGIGDRPNALKLAFPRPCREDGRQLLAGLTPTPTPINHRRYAPGPMDRRNAFGPGDHQHRTAPVDHGSAPGPIDRRYAPRPADHQHAPGPVDRRYAPGPIDQRYAPGPAEHQRTPGPGDGGYTPGPIEQQYGPHLTGQPPVRGSIDRPYAPGPAEHQRTPGPGDRGYTPGPVDRRYGPGPGDQRYGPGPGDGWYGADGRRRG